MGIKRFLVSDHSIKEEYMRVYPKVPGLAAWSENCKWYSSLPVGAVA
jgi:L-ribulose-5-phosphate 3-epimerase UlaE